MRDLVPSPQLVTSNPLPSSELVSFRTGFEYIVAHARAPDVFVIHRRPVLRDSSRGPVTHAYFILQDKVYMAPNLFDVAVTRLRNATHLVERTFDALEAARPSANPRAGSQWRAIPKTEKEKEKEGKDANEGGKKEEDADGDAAMEDAGAKEAMAAEGDDTEADSSGGGKKDKTTSGPDWHLMHALASTRAALGDLDKLAAAPPPTVDAVAETKALEAAALAALGRVPPQQIQQQQQQVQQLAPPTAPGTAAPSPFARRMGTLAPSLGGESPLN